MTQAPSKIMPPIRAISGVPWERFSTSLASIMAKTMAAMPAAGTIQNIPGIYSVSFLF
jgi:hypothetical protein